MIDRKDGRLLSAEKFGKVTWASHIDMETGRPVEMPGARYEDGEEEIWPSPFGVHNWHAMSYNPLTGLAYLPTIELPAVFRDTGVDIKEWESPSFRVRVGVEGFTEDTPSDIGWATLLAWDPIKQKEAWSVPLPNNWNPGTMTTASKLLFQGRADGVFVAYDAETGKELWSKDLGLGISAPPVTYTVDGEQRVTVLVGWGGSGPNVSGTMAAQYGWAYKAQPRRAFTFSLNGKAAMPPQSPEVFPKPVDVAGFEIDDTKADAGRLLYAETCVLCHGGGAVSGGSSPDLRASPMTTNLAVFSELVKNGRLELGMPPYRDLSDAEIETLFHYIRRQARTGVQTAATD